jgi:riboflavin-specific deaminase-like protein
VTGVLRRPHVSVHVAQSLDGRIALEGAATTLSTKEGQERAHGARAASDAVLVGARTVRIDDPRLTVRLVPLVERPNPLRVVLASALDLPLQARVFSRRGRVLVIGAEGRAPPERRAALESTGAEVAIVAAGDDGLVAPAAALEVLAQRSIERVLIEGGARILTSFFRARLVDRATIEIATSILGAPATPVLGQLGVDTLDHAPSLIDVSVERVGTHVLVTGDVRYASRDGEPR